MSNTGFVGVDHFYYMITDTTGASSIAQVAITVTEIDAPTAADDAIEILEGSVAAVTIDVLDNDSFGSNGAALSNSLEIIPTTTTAVVVNGTSIEYTPTGTQTGTDTFTYRIKDADGETSDATVTVTFTEQRGSSSGRRQRPGRYQSNFPANQINKQRRAGQGEATRSCLTRLQKAR